MKLQTSKTKKNDDKLSKNMKFVDACVGGPKFTRQSKLRGVPYVISTKTTTCKISADYPIIRVSATDLRVEVY